VGADTGVTPCAFVNTLVSYVGGPNPDPNPNPKPNPALLGGAAHRPHDLQVLVMQPNSGPILALNPTYASPAPTHNQAMLPELNEYHGGDKAELAWSALNAQQHPLYSPTSTSTPPTTL